MPTFNTHLVLFFFSWKDLSLFIEGFQRSSQFIVHLGGGCMEW